MSTRSPSRIWLLGFFLFTILCSILAGAIVGGVAGYVVAGDRAADIVPLLAEPVLEPTRTVSAPRTPTVPSSPTSSPTSTATPRPTASPAVSPTVAAPEPQSVPEEEAFVTAVDRVLPAVVTVISQLPIGTGGGSGFFISEDGYVVTNNHVVEDASSVSIIYARGGEVPATVVGTAPDFDLAVLRVDGPVPAVVEWGDSGALPLGSRVIAIGSALGSFRNTVTSGVLSGFNRELGPLRGLLQTDAAVNRGNSGGPLVNLAGEVVGVNTAVVRGGQSLAEGLGFAIPSNIAQSVVTRLIETGEVRTPYLGVNFEDLSPQLAMQEGIDVSDGAILRDVVADTPAARAGLQLGDVVVAINDVAIDERHSLLSLLLQYAPGETITLDVRRDGESLTVELTLGERP